MQSKIVVHMKDGTIHKGVTHDFTAGLESFHLLPAEGGGIPKRIATDQMKALFYVKDYIGNRDFVARRAFQEAKQQDARAIVRFADGEEIWGYLGEGASDAAGIGFFFFPADDDDNNIRIYVIRSALESMKRVE